MEYARIVTPQRTALIALEPTNFGAPYQKLFDQTDASGHEVFALESVNNFNNPFQQASEQRYAEKGWWAEIFRDIVRNGSGSDDRGRLNVNYVSHAGTDFERVHNVWAPKNGWYVPTNDGVFVPETLIPFETVQDRNEAIKRLETKGVPKEQVSYFYRLDDYRGNERFVGRGFLPGVGDCGRFGVYAGWLPSYSGDGGVGSRPAYGNPSVVMELNTAQQK